MSTRSDWVRRGREAVVELLAEHLAAPLVEIEARICDRAWANQPKPIAPLLLTRARKDLELTGLVEQVEATTRGGGTVALLRPNPIPQATGDEFVPLLPPNWPFSFFSYSLVGGGRTNSRRRR